MIDYANLKIGLSYTRKDILQQFVVIGMTDTITPHKGDAYRIVVFETNNVNMLIESIIDIGYRLTGTTSLVTLI